MSVIPFKKQQESKHPVIKEYEELLNKVNSISGDKWDKLFLEFYTKNTDFIDNAENLNSNVLISKIIMIKVVFIRILDGKAEYKQSLKVAEQLESLLLKLDENYYDYNKVCISAKKWIAVSLARNGKYIKSNKIFKEIICLEKEKEFYTRWISSNCSRIICKYFLYPIFFICSISLILNAICVLVDNYLLYIPKPYSTIANLLFLATILLYYSLDKPTRKLVERKYK